MSEIHAAVQSGSLESVSALLDSKPHLLNVRDERGWEPLMLALVNKSFDLARLLVKRGANPSEQLIHFVYGDLDILETLIALKADVNTDIGNGTVLHHAATQGKLETVRLFLKNGADPNAKGWLGRTPLISAVGNNRLEVIELLLENGADIERSEMSLTPLSLAFSGKYLQTAELLLSKGADPHAAEGQAMTRAIWGTSTDAIQLLLNFNFNINLGDGKHWTPLHTAAMGRPFRHGPGSEAERLESEDDFFPIVRFLVSKGASLTTTEGRGKLPWQTAERYGNSRIASFLMPGGKGGA